MQSSDTVGKTDYGLQAMYICMAQKLGGPCTFGPPTARK